MADVGIEGNHISASSKFVAVSFVYSMKFIFYFFERYHGNLEEEEQSLYKTFKNLKN